MTRSAVVDPALAVHVLTMRPLIYDQPADPEDDRPAHVRAASGLAFQNGRLVIVQDDASFLAVVSSEGVSSIKLPRGLHGRRRFEVALGNKLDKLDLESCVVIDEALWAFGSGSLPIRDKICIVEGDVARVRDAGPLYDAFRDLVGSAVNLEGVARVRDELWLFHRGNTGPADPGPAVVRLELASLQGWLAGEAPLPALLGIDRFDLGTIEGAQLGFTDAIALGDRVFYLATAELSPNAVDDGHVVGSQLGVIVGDSVRAAPLAGPSGEAVKAEGIAFDPARPGHAWIALDPDDPELPAVLLDVELRGPWFADAT